MSLTKYRVVTRLNDTARYELYYVQVRWAFIWWDATEAGVMGYQRSINFTNLEDAKKKVHDLVKKNEEELARKKKLKAFKSKVVYGPYPP